MLHAFGGGTADNAGDAQRVIVVNVDRKHQLQILELCVKLDEPALRSKAKDIENMEQTSIHALITYGGTKVSSQKRYTLGLSSVSPFYDHEVPEMSKYQMRIDVNSCKKAQGTTHLAQTVLKKATPSLVVHSAISPNLDCHSASPACTTEPSRLLAHISLGGMVHKSAKECVLTAQVGERDAT